MLFISRSVYITLEVQSQKYIYFVNKQFSTKCAKTPANNVKDKDSIFYIVKKQRNESLQFFAKLTDV